MGWSGVVWCGVVLCRVALRCVFALGMRGALIPHIEIPKLLEVDSSIDDRKQDEIRLEQRDDEDWIIPKNRQGGGSSRQKSREGGYQLCS